MKFQVVVLVAVVCIVLGYSKSAETAEKRLSKTEYRQDASPSRFVARARAAVPAGKTYYPKKSWKASKTNSAQWRPVESPKWRPVESAQWRPAKSYPATFESAPLKSSGKWASAVRSQKWEVKPQVATFAKRPAAKVHWVSKRAPDVKSVPCRTTEPPTFRPSFVASPARSAPSWTAAKATQTAPDAQVSSGFVKQQAPAAPVAEAAPAAPLAASLPAKQFAREPVVAQQAPQVALAAKEPLAAVPAAGAKMSFAAEPDRISYYEVMEPEP